MSNNRIDKPSYGNQEPIVKKETRGSKILSGALKVTIALLAIGLVCAILQNLKVIDVLTPIKSFGNWFISHPDARIMFLLCSSGIIFTVMGYAAYHYCTHKSKSLPPEVSPGVLPPPKPASPSPIKPSSQINSSSSQPPPKPASPSPIKPSSRIDSSKQLQPAAEQVVTVPPPVNKPVPSAKPPPPLPKSQSPSPIMKQNQQFIV